MVLHVQVQAVIPLLALVFPTVWRFLDAYGNAKVELAFEDSVHLKIVEVWEKYWMCNCLTAFHCDTGYIKFVAWGFCLRQFVSPS